MLAAVISVMYLSLATMHSAFETFPRSYESLVECPEKPVENNEQAIIKICPPRAICGDSWNTVSLLLNGTRCLDHNTIERCMCENHPCPIGDSNHVLYSNDKHSMYVCQQRCSVEMCSSILRPSIEMIQNSPDFNFENYYAVNCRCPGHNHPLQSRPDMLFQATKFRRIYFDFTSGTIRHQYTCNSYVSLDDNEDNCLRTFID